MVIQFPKSVQVGLVQNVTKLWILLQVFIEFLDVRLTKLLEISTIIMLAVSENILHSFFSVSTFGGPPK